MKSETIAATGMRTAKAAAIPFRMEDGTQSRALHRVRLPAKDTAIGANPNSMTTAPTSIPRATRFPSSANPGRELKFRLRKTAAVVTEAHTIPGPTALRSFRTDPGEARASR